MKEKQHRFNNERRVAARQFLRASWLPLLAVAVCVGCAQHSSVAPAADPAGSYTLVSVDGKNVPCEVRHEQATLQVASGTFDINADGTCRSRVTFSRVGGDKLTRDVRATYTRSGDKLTMRWERAGTTVGVVQADNFTMTNEGMVFAYRR